MKSTSQKVWYKPSEFIDVEPPLKWADIKLDTPYRVSMPSKSLTGEGMMEVRNYLREQDFRDRVTGNRISIPVDMSPEWVVTNKDGDAGRVGTMPKRISKHLHKEHGIKTTPEFMTEVGNIARKHTVDEDVFVFDITQSLDWNPGDFGDSGSCWWESEDHARQGMIAAGQYALRLFRPTLHKTETGRTRAWGARHWTCGATGDRVTLHTKTFNCNCNECTYSLREMELDVERLGEYIMWRYMPLYTEYPQGAGYGRAWMVRDGENLITFNSYGEYQLLQMSRILATIMGVSYRKTRLDHYDNAVYLNGDACVIGSDVQALRHMTLGFEVDRTNRYTCEICDEGIHEDDVYFQDATTMCDYCYRDRVSYCGGCEDPFWNDDINSVEIIGMDYCNDCIDEHAPACVLCDDRHDPTSMTYVDGMGDVCITCYSERYTQCETCNEVIEHSNAYKIDYRTLCPECYEKEMEDTNDKV